MTIEIDNENELFRLVDGEEGTSSYLTGTTANYGERSILDETVADPWYAEIDDNGECDGYAHNSSTSQPVGFELDCEFEDSDEEETDDEEDEVIV